MNGAQATVEIISNFIILTEYGVLVGNDPGSSCRIVSVLVSVIVPFEYLCVDVEVEEGGRSQST